MQAGTQSTNNAVGCLVLRHWAEQWRVIEGRLPRHVQILTSRRVIPHKQLPLGSLAYEYTRTGVSLGKVVGAGCVGGLPCSSGKSGRGGRSRGSADPEVEEARQGP